MPPRRRVLFLLGGAVSSSILRGYSETECLLEVDDCLDDDDPFFFGEKACKQARWMAKSKVVPAYKLEHTNKELDGRLTSLLLLARFFSSAPCCFVTACTFKRLVHSFACIIAPSTW
jgi:hypothetical protein